MKNQHFCRNLIILLLPVILFLEGCSAGDDMARIRIDSKVYSFELASTQEERARGLMYRKDLAPDSGMLFVYPAEAYRQFYMKNTFIPLDIAFIDKNWKIMDLQQMEPLDETITYSRARAQYVLETNQGFFERVGLSVGDTLEVVGSVPSAR